MGVEADRGQEGAHGGNEHKMRQSSKGLRPQAIPWLHTLVSSTDCKDRQPLSFLIMSP